MSDQIIIVTRGLPASGKTRYAKSLGDGFVRVSRDDIRAMLTGRAGKFAGDHKFEERVTEIEEQAVRSAIAGGFSVVVDDMNLRLKYAKRWVALANTLGVESDVVNFKEPLDVLLERNARRMDKVPEDLIRDLYKRFPPSQWQPVLLPVMEAHATAQYVPDTTRPKAISVDLDGTLALHNRNPYDTSLYHTDTVHEGLRDVVNRLYDTCTVYVLTGRDAAFREECERWLNVNGVKWDRLLMRPEGDKRQDGVIKVELFNEHIAPVVNHIIHFDDRDRVVQALRSIGVTVAQVAEGAF